MKPPVHGLWFYFEALNFEDFMTSILLYMYVRG